MKMKSIPISLIAVTIISLAFIAPIHASYQPAIYARTDKPAYSPGDSGTLFITVRNQGTQAFTVRNLTVTYPWHAFITDHWDGNFSTNGISQAIASGQQYNTQYSFTVPTDGRASNIFGGTISISVGTDIGSSGSYYPGSATIAYTLPTYQPIGLATSVLPIVEIALLAVAVIMLALVFFGIKKLTKK